MGMRRTIEMPWSLREQPASESAEQIVGKRHRSMPHLGRKAYHAAMGIACALLYGLVVSREQALILLGAIGGSWITLDWMRLRSQKMNQLALRWFGGLMRSNEINSLSGNSYYIMGMALVVLVFPKPIALLSILFLGLGDPVAATVGTHLGKTKLWAGKSLEGAMANLAVSSTVTFIFGVWYLGLSEVESLGLAVLGGTISTVAELIPIKIDDNFTIPVLSAAFLYLLSVSVGISPML